MGRNHPFIDGNKRASFAAVDVFLRSNRYRLDVTPGAAIEWLLERFETRTFTKRELDDWLRRVVVSD
ncbi:MAG: Fic family protein [Chloroflexota bacterium]